MRTEDAELENSIVCFFRICQPRLPTGV